MRTFNQGSKPINRCTPQAGIKQNNQVFWKDGDVVLRPLKRTWQDYFDRGRKFSDDFSESIEDMALEENFPW